MTPHTLGDTPYLFRHLFHQTAVTVGILRDGDLSTCYHCRPVCIGSKPGWFHFIRSDQRVQKMVPGQFFQKAFVWSISKNTSNFELFWSDLGLAEKCWAGFDSHSFFVKFLDHGLALCLLIMDGLRTLNTLLTWLLFYNLENCNRHHSGMI